jgi:phosphoribosylformimino-5-aminoimidazole carboxamide ribotide isomerase
VILHPAIDILGGQAVRLLEGDYEASTVYDQDPLAAAQRWVQAGADHLHVVDLDGAREGRPVNLEHLRRICAQAGDSGSIPVQVGGGLRNVEAISAALDAGAARVILGTAAFTDPHLLEQALAAHGPERVMVSVDARAGQVVTDGWTKATDTSVASVIADVRARGVTELLYTNVDRDGKLTGIGTADVLAAAEAAGTGRLIYSGGVGTIEDLHQLAALQAPSLVGVIVGKALYEGRFTIAEAQQALA